MKNLRPEKIDSRASTASEADSPQRLRASVEAVSHRQRRSTNNPRLKLSAGKGKPGQHNKQFKGEDVLVRATRAGRGSVIFLHASSLLKAQQTIRQSHTGLPTDQYPVGSNAKPRLRNRQRKEAPPKGATCAHPPTKTTKTQTTPTHNPPKQILPPPATPTTNTQPNQQPQTPEPKPPKHR